MTELERELRSLAADVAWPETPSFAGQLDERRRPALRRPLLFAAAAIVVALAVALSVPAARSEILRIFHLGGVTVERVDVLPPAQERPLGAALGPVVGAAAARTALGAPVRLPKLEGATPLHLRDRVVSVLLATPQPVLLSEFRDGAFLLKKIAGGTTRIVYVRLGNGPGLWIAGARHVFALPDAPPRLAGNVLVWQLGPITYRLEGRALTKQKALELATEIDGT